MSPRLLWIVSAALLSMFVVLGCGDVTEYADEEAVNNSGTGEGEGKGEGEGEGEGEGGEGEGTEPEAPEEGPRRVAGTSIDVGSAPILPGYRCTTSAPLPQGDDAECEGFSEASCAANTPPRLGFPTFLIDGELREEPGVSPATAQILLLIPFEDDECNLACGEASHGTSVSGQSYSNGSVGGETLSPELGCSSAETGLCFTLWLETEESLDWSIADLQVTDACGAPSNKVEVRLDFE